MLMTVIVILSLLGAVGYGFAASVGVAGLWKCALVFVGGVLGLSALFLLFALVVSFFIDPSWPRKTQNPICRFLVAQGGNMICFFTRVHTHVSGLEKLPENGRFLMVVNHRSAFDPISQFYPLRKYNLAYISKPENLRLFMVGRIVSGACFLPIDRNNDREAIKSILAAVDYLKRDICSICIYPEGTRSKTGELLPFHHGSFKIAQRAGVPLVIAACSGSEKAKKNLFLRPTHIYLDIAEVVPAEQVKAMTTAELSDHARDVIAAALKEREGKA
jgi:1-acyl-sn-glycerol-3-phosphate acyltransferase